MTYQALRDTAQGDAYSHFNLSSSQLDIDVGPCEEEETQRASRLRSRVISAAATISEAIPWIKRPLRISGPTVLLISRRARGG
jgi:hypothetical protein